MRWHSLYLSSEADIPQQIDRYLTHAGYTRYNPFGKSPGMAYGNTLKTFTKVMNEHWSRVLVDSNLAEADALAQALSHESMCLSVALDGSTAFVHAYRVGVLDNDLVQALAPFTKPDTTIEPIINADEFNLPPIERVQVGDVTLDDIPDDLREYVGQVDGKNADSLFQRISRRLLKTIGARDAGALLNNRVDWNSQGGQMIRALMACLTIPDDWRVPDFDAVRTAYTVTSRQTHFPNAKPFPNDAEALQAVPDVLDYIPVYGGR